MTINVVVDISHHNGNPDLAKAADAGIVGVIHKATEGQTMVDDKYIQNRESAIAAGLLWGAYHFGTSGDGSSQADHFLDTVEPDEQTLLVLDYESNGNSTMTLAQARAFVLRINEVTGRFPGLYSGLLIKRKLGNQPRDLILSKCFLWIAQYGPAPTKIPPTWARWTLWQYTDGVAGPQPHSVEGIGLCDRDRFNGRMKGLLRLWGVEQD
ncbi:MAG TPA: glycoside hydrolase family 25 protein [Pyrinomonadaceae bacterium]